MWCGVIFDAEKQPLMALYPDFAAAMGWSKWTTYQARDRGQVPTMQIGSRTFVIVAEWRRLLGLPATEHIDGPGCTPGPSQVPDHHPDDPKDTNDDSATSYAVSTLHRS
jgi:hypothetical protein